MNKEVIIIFLGLFVFKNKMVSIGSNTTRKIQDYSKNRIKGNIYFKTDKLFYEVGKVRYMWRFYLIILKVLTLSGKLV